MMLPFQSALGPAMEGASPKIKEHFLQPPGTRHYRGTMHRVWRRSGWPGWIAALFLWKGRWLENLFADTGTDVPFELENTVTPLPDGRASMTWMRTFHFPRGTRHFAGLMLFEPERGVIVDWLGKLRHLEVELHPSIDQGAVCLTSGRQWMRLGRLRLPLPRWLSGQARVREWEEPDGALGVRVVVTNPLLGEFFGYEGSFREVEAVGEGSSLNPAQPDRSTV